MTHRSVSYRENRSGPLEKPTPSLSIRTGQEKKNDVFFLLLSVLYAWSRAARLLGRPAPPIPDLQPAADELAALVRSGLAGLASAFRRVAQGQPGSSRVLACLAAAAACSASSSRR
ncbi:reticulon-like protein B12 [Hordeum vulgare]|nr:reticulon-like protein B12 [Hordeum vulgare]